MLQRKAIRVLLEGAPEGMTPEDIGWAMARSEQVTEVHDLHLWEYAPGHPVLTAHVLVAEGSDCRDASRPRDDVEAALRGIAHATLQVDRAHTQLLSDHARPVITGTISRGSMSAIRMHTARVDAIALTRCGGAAQDDLDLDADIIEGARGEFSVWVRAIGRWLKSAAVFPSDDAIVAAVEGAAAPPSNLGFFRPSPTTPPEGPRSAGAHELRRAGIQLAAAAASANTIIAPRRRVRHIGAVGLKRHRAHA